MPHPNTFDLGTDGLISEDPAVTTWMRAITHVDEQPST